ncbi:hypothetical protein A6A06_24180 [Streptomyces sp. CB02923]|nr:hypothetical protein A6A06_24180 [Streptomyces sp. CB02923]
MTVLPRITAATRRARLVRRHLLVPAVREKTAEAVAEALVGLHATDPATVFLATAARMHRPTVAAIERPLYDSTTATGCPALERIRCMRRTMFVLPARLAPAVQSATVRDTHRHRVDAMAKLHDTLGWNEGGHAVAAQGARASTAHTWGRSAARSAARPPMEWATSTTGTSPKSSASSRSACRVSYRASAAGPFQPRRR